MNEPPIVPNEIRAIFQGRVFSVRIEIHRDDCLNPATVVSSICSRGADTAVQFRQSSVKAQHPAALLQEDSHEQGGIFTRC